MHPNYHTPHITTHPPPLHSLGPADQVVYDPYTPEQRAEVRRLCERYLRASADEEDDMLVFQSVRQMREMCRQFKSLVADLLAAQANNAMNHGTAVYDFFPSEIRLPRISSAPFSRSCLASTCQS